MGRGSVALSTLAMLMLAISGQLAGVLAGCTQRSEPFDFFYFVQQWPGSFCALRGCCVPESEGPPQPLFTIHGLWPNYAQKNSYPCECDPTSVLDPQLIEDLQPRLDILWDSLKCGGTDQSFWNHEWVTHGTCSAMSEHDYFGAALSLYNTVDVTGALRAAEIVPSDTRKYAVEDINAAVIDGIGYASELHCKQASGGPKYLFEIRTCVEPDGVTIFDCPFKGNCFGRVYIPVFKVPQTDSEAEL